jgi:hypothetical protein
MPSAIPIAVHGICSAASARRAICSDKDERDETIIPSKLNGKPQKIICRGGINLR